MNIEAAGAELAVAKYLNVYPDLAPTFGSLPHWDLLWLGRHIEVKRNHLLGGDLLVPKLDETVVYILACGGLPQYHIVGYIDGVDVPLVGEWVELRYGACWRVNPNYLTSLQ